MSSSPKVLLAGFGPFPGAPRNPTEELMRRPSEEWADDVGTCILSVSWEQSWPELRQHIEAVRPQIVLLFGLQMRIERLRIERLARNRRELGQEDAHGDFPSGPGVAEGPEYLPGRLPWLGCAAALRDLGIEFEWSNNAGGYLCNQTYYHLALAAPELGVERFGFFHVPPTDEIIGEIDPLVAPMVHCSVPKAKLAAAAAALARAAAAGLNSG